MLKVILIDDDTFALRKIEFLLKNKEDIEVVGTFTDPHKGIDAVAELKPNAVFLDTEVTQLMSAYVESTILDRCTETSMVFMSDCGQYAVDAYEKRATDYIIKPISEQRLNNTLARLRNKARIIDPDSEKKLEINCLGRFQIGFKGQKPIKWCTEKTQEVFAFLLHNRGRKVNSEEMMGQIWPDTDPIMAGHLLHNAIYFIQKTLKEYGIYENQAQIVGRYSLIIKDAELDAEQFAEWCERRKISGNIEDCIGCISKYTGEYFESSGWIWAVKVRELLAREYLKTVLVLAEQLMRNGEYESTEDLLLNAYYNCPYEESVTEWLLDLYSLTGDKVKAMLQFQEYSRTLKNELGVNPSANVVKKITEIQGIQNLQISY